jgi:CHAD domain-containing protein
MPDLLTFDVPGLVSLPTFDGEDGAGVEGVSAVRRSGRLLLRSTYLDAADLRLARDGVRLRHQSGGGPAQWQLRLGDDEVVVPGAVTAVPAQVIDLLLVRLRGEPLIPVAALRTERHVLVLLGAQEEELAELVDDEVAVLDGRRVALKHRELTLRRGERPDRDSYDGDQPVPEPKRVVEDVAQLLLAAGAVTGEQVPAVSRALGPRASAAPEVRRRGPLSPDSPAGDVALHALRSGTRKLIEADTAVRLGSPDGVHQLRVSCRRLRSDLTTFAPLVDPARAEALRDGTRWLAGELGPARDTEVLRERLAVSAASDTLLPIEPSALLRLDARLAARAAAAEERAVAALREQRYLALVGALVAACTDPGRTALAARPADEVLPALVGHAWHRLEQRAGKLRRGDPDERWHDARKAAKRARYAAEAVVPALGKRATATAKAAAALQEVLGEHQDGAVAADALILLAAEDSVDAAYAVALGRLAERQRASVLAARAAFPAVWRTTSVAKVARWTSPA